MGWGYVYHIFHNMILFVRSGFQPRSDEHENEVYHSFRPLFLYLFVIV